MIFELKIYSSALLNLKQLPRQEYQTAVNTIASLKSQPKPTESHKLKGRPAYVLSTKKVKIIYQVNEKERVVTVVCVVPKANPFSKFADVLIVEDSILFLYQHQRTGSAYSYSIVGSDGNVVAGAGENTFSTAEQAIQHAKDFVRNRTN